MTPAERTARLLRDQQAACAELGSPLYAHLLGRLADDLLGGGPAADVLAGSLADPGPSALGLRLLGSVHRLVLERRAPALAVHYPSVGGTAADPDAAWAALRRVLADRRDDVRAGLGHPPQTNEVGRAAALVGGLLHVVAERDLPVRLVEVGASAGLNLRADHFRVTAVTGAAATVGTAVGPAGSAVVLRDAWRAAPGATLPPAAAPLRVVERRGGDIDPVDPGRPEGRLLLTSYVWPDQVERHERLRGALAVAARVPAVLVRAGARELLETTTLRPGHWTVVWHSVMWQYLDPAERRAVRARIDALGAQASAAAPLAHLALEPRRRAPSEPHRFLVTLATWPGGSERVLGEAHPHGLPVTWE